MAEKKRNSYDNLVMDIMHISKSEYDLLTQRNNDLENYTNHLIEKNNELRKENEMLKQEKKSKRKTRLIHQHIIKITYPYETTVKDTEYMIKYIKSVITRETGVEPVIDEYLL